ncbi:PEP-CTERM sorting domain-containing protein [Marinimicrobium alkaliphilum]|uniref:PEP-CTERM sorting domain-containing protein n=1 Tax=Marinimicrobium alkaliphilum TaxID=2202654 RepID=UPI000DBA6169|nr:PEP-CTERM sorting domain-containing protein [Marinimicrobium alkaliphilum]
MNKSFKGIRGLLVLAAFLVAGHAQALMLTPGDIDASTDIVHNNTSALSANNVAVLFGTSSTLTSLYKADYDEGTNSELYGDFYATNFWGDPNHADIINLGPESISCVECYLVVKDGNQPQYLFDLSTRGWNGSDTINLRDFYLNTQGAISHVAIFGVVAQVPEAGALVLMGLGLLGLGLARRRETKVSA